MTAIVLDQVDPKRRRLLVLGTSALGAVGTVAVAWPFLKSWVPSERAKSLGAPVEQALDKLEPGQRLVAEWRGQPVWIVSRTKAMLEELAKNDAKLSDPSSKASKQPAYAQNATRSIKPEMLVVTGICTHLGCSPNFFPVKGEGVGADWPGGFYCACHGSKFDLAGRVFAGSPAPTNLPVPPHRYLGEGKLVIGEDETKGA